jgi:hypothetical protein
MLIAQHSETTTVDPKIIWKAYQQVEAWPAWNEFLESANIEGIFSVGAMGKLKPTGGSEMTFTITNVQPYHSFSISPEIPFATLTFDSIITRDADHTLITHRAHIAGILGFLFAILMRRSITKMFPISMKKLVHMAETARNKK